MRKIGFILAPLGVLAAIAGFFLRRMEIAAVFDPQSGLATPNAPISIVLMAVSAAVVLLFFGLSFLAPKRKGARFEAAFDCGAFGRTLLALCAVGILLIGGGRIVILVILSEMSVLPLLWAVVAFLAGLFLLLMALLGPTGRNVAIISAGSVFLVCAWLVLLYIDNASNPVLLSYVYQLFALAFLLLSLYYVAGFAFGQGKARGLTWSAPAATYFIGLTLADGRPLYQTIVLAFFVITALIYLLILTHNLKHSVWDESSMWDEQRDGDEET